VAAVCGRFHDRLRRPRGRGEPRWLVRGCRHVAAHARSPARAVRRGGGAAEAGVRHDRRPDRRAPDAVVRARRLRRCLRHLCARGPAGLVVGRAPRPGCRGLGLLPRRLRTGGAPESFGQARTRLRELRVLQEHRLHGRPAARWWAGVARRLPVAVRGDDGARRRRCRLGADGRTGCAPVAADAADRAGPRAPNHRSAVPSSDDRTRCRDGRVVHSLPRRPRCPSASDSCR